MIRTAFVVTDHPETVSNAVINNLQRGVTAISARGMYTHEERSLLYITISRVQVNDLRHVIGEVDPNAFVVIGQGHTAYGEGFKPIKRNRKALDSEATATEIQATPNRATDRTAGRATPREAMPV